MASCGKARRDGLMPDIFLSYSREDQATARRYADALGRAGFDVWWDQALHPGEAFDQVTERALEEARAVIVLWSRASVQSRWVRAEATQANADNRLVPVMIEPCKRPIMFELVHTAELADWNGDEADPRWQSFIASLSRTAGRPVESAASPAPGPVLTRHSGVRGVAIALGVLLIVGAAAWALRAGLHLQGAAQSPVVAALPAATAPPAAAEPIRILVLPFANQSPDQEQDYFADNLASEISNLLGQVKGLRPLGDATSRALRGKEAAEIVKAVDVRYLVDGVVYKEGESNRVIIAQLLDREGARLWSHKYVRTLAETSSLYEEIAKDVVQHVGIVLDVGSMPRALGGSTNPAAYDKFLRASAPVRVRPGADPLSEQEARERLQLLREAVALDPQFATAWISLLTLFSNAAAGASGPEAKALLREREETTKRLLGMRFDGWLDYRIHAEAYMYQRRWAEAVAAARAAVAAAPSEESGAKTIWPILMRVGWFEEAIPYMKAALRSDPLDFRSASRLGDALRLTGRDDEVQALVAQFGAANVPMAFRWATEDFWRLLEYGTHSNPADLAAMKKSLVGPIGRRVQEDSGVTAGIVGDPAAIRSTLRHTLDDPRQDNEFTMTLVSPLATFFGERELAFEAFRRMALDSRVSSVGPWAVPRLRQEPGFKQLLRDLRLVDYWRQENRWSDFCRPLAGDDFECFEKLN